MDNSNQDSSLYFINILKSFLKRNMMNILEEETNRREIIINSNCICQTVNSLDLLDGMGSIPEEFSIENFTNRFNTIHDMNLTTSIL